MPICCSFVPLSSVCVLAAHSSSGESGFPPFLSMRALRWSTGRPELRRPGQSVRYYTPPSSIRPILSIPYYRSFHIIGRDGPSGWLAG